MRDVAGGGGAGVLRLRQEDEAAGSIVGGAGGGERCAIIARGVVDNDNFGGFRLGEGGGDGAANCCGRAPGGDHHRDVALRVGGGGRVHSGSGQG